MNKQRRKQINKIIARLEELSAELEEIREEISDLSYEEQEALENLPESIQEGEKGQVMQEAIDNLDSAVEETDIEEMISYLESAKGE